MILDKRLDPACIPTSPLTKPTRDVVVFEPGISLDGGKFTFVRNPTAKGLVDIYEMASREISAEIASLEVMRAVHNHNPQSFWSIYRSDDERRCDPCLAGFFAFLPLSEVGLEAYRSGRLTPRNPNLDHLVPAGKRPVAFYLWATVAHRLASVGGALIAHAFGVNWFFDIPVFGTVGTRSGLNALRSSDKICPDAGAAQIGNRFEIKLPPEVVAWTKSLPVKSGVSAKSRASAQALRQKVVVVRNAEDLSKAFSIRTTVYMAEQSCPYNEEFDGNDYTAMHLLGTVGGEPAATLRIRFFAGFAKLERWSVLPKFRGTLIGRGVVEQAIRICRRKGYSSIYVHAQIRYVEKWKRFGLQPMLKDSKFVFSQHEYVEMSGKFEPAEDALTLDCSPYVLIRPEGSWDAPGILEKSTGRVAISPF